VPEFEFRGPGVDGAREFRTTHWSVVLAARDGGPTQAAGAWEDLCRSYWYPLYAYLRRIGQSPHDAQDLTQEFLTRLIANADLQGVERGRGRFRSYLLGTLKHFLSDERKKANAQKRGGGRPLVSIDEVDAEARYRIEPVDTATPEIVFERQWGLTVLARVSDRLRADFEARGKGAVWAALEPCLGGGRQPAFYAEIGALLGMTEGGVKVAVHRLRREFGQLLRAELAATVADESEIDDELRHFIRVTTQ